MASLAHRLGVVQVEEQFLRAFVSNLVVHVGRTRVASLPSDYDAFAPLTHEQIAEQRLLPDAERPSPTWITIESAVGFGLG